MSINIKKDGSSQVIMNVSRFVLEPQASGKDIFIPSQGKGFTVIDWSVVGASKAIGSTIVDWENKTLVELKTGTSPFAFGTVDDADVLGITVPSEAVLSGIFRDGRNLEIRLGELDEEESST